MRRGARGAGLGCAIVAVAAGCSAPPAAPRGGGVALELSIRAEANYAVLYRVQRDGVLGWGGGADAQQRRVSWTGHLSDPEIDALGALLVTEGWFREAPAVESEDPARRASIRLEGPQGRRRYTVRGRSASVDRVAEHLERIARRRYDALLESLPAPGSPVPPAPAPAPAPAAAEPDAGEP